MTDKTISPLRQRMFEDKALESRALEQLDDRNGFCLLQFASGALSPSATH